MQTNNKSLQYLTHLLTTHCLLIAALSPAPLHDCQSPKNLLYHIQDWRRDCTLFAEGVPHTSPFQQTIGTELFSIFLASRPCLLSFNAEEKTTETKGPSFFLRFTLGRQDALVIKQSKRFPNLA